MFVCCIIDEFHLMGLIKTTFQKWPITDIDHLDLYQTIPDFSNTGKEAFNLDDSIFLLSDKRLTHYQTTNFRLFQTERICRRQFQIGRKWKKVIQTGRKCCGKRRNCSLRAISPFPTVFSKGLFPKGVKRCHCVGMG